LPISYLQKQKHKIITVQLVGSLQSEPGLSKAIGVPKLLDGHADWPNLLSGHWLTTKELADGKETHFTKRGISNGPRQRNILQKKPCDMRFTSLVSCHKNSAFGKGSSCAIVGIRPNFVTAMAQD